MVLLVGYTGFVGTNLAKSYDFDGLYNSKNIQEAFGTNPDILYYSGVPAQKFIANKFPDEDMQVIQTAIENIKKINPKKVVLISTVDVYKNPNGKDEFSDMQTDDQEAYGKNRLYLEKFVQENFDHHIVRLPALYGANLKKNFIYDYINFIPSMLTNAKYDELSEKSNLIKNSYTDLNNGFVKLNTDIDRIKLKQEFENVNFSALNFTDSRAVFQFYNLKYLFNDINTIINNNVKVFNIATQPVSASEVYSYVTGKVFDNVLNNQPPYYDFKTAHYELFNGENGYIQNKNFVLEDIKSFISEGI